MNAHVVSGAVDASSNASSSFFEPPAKRSRLEISDVSPSLNGIFFEYLTA